MFEDWAERFGKLSLKIFKRRLKLVQLSPVSWIQRILPISEGDYCLLFYQSIWGIAYYYLLFCIARSPKSRKIIFLRFWFPPLLPVNQLLWVDDEGDDGKGEAVPQVQDTYDLNNILKTYIVVYIRLPLKWWSRPHWASTSQGTRTQHRESNQAHSRTDLRRHLLWSHLQLLPLASKIMAIILTSAYSRSAAVIPDSLLDKRRVSNHLPHQQLQCKCPEKPKNPVINVVCAPD